MFAVKKGQKGKEKKHVGNFGEVGTVVARYLYSG